jgi:hypothetical protein
VARDTAPLSSLLATFRDNVLVSTSKLQCIMFNLLKKMPPYFLETSGTDYSVTRRRVSEDDENRQLIRCPRAPPAYPSFRAEQKLTLCLGRHRKVCLSVCLVRMRLSLLLSHTASRQQCHEELPIVSMLIEYNMLRNEAAIGTLRETKNRLYSGAPCHRSVKYPH